MYTRSYCTRIMSMRSHVVKLLLHERLSYICAKRKQDSHSCTGYWYSTSWCNAMPNCVLTRYSYRAHPWEDFVYLSYWAQIYMSTRSYCTRIMSMRSHVVKLLLHERLSCIYVNRTQEYYSWSTRSIHKDHVHEKTSCNVRYNCVLIWYCYSERPQEYTVQV